MPNIRTIGLKLDADQANAAAERTQRTFYNTRDELGRFVKQVDIVDAKLAALTARANEARNALMLLSQAASINAPYINQNRTNQGVLGGSSYGAATIGSNQTQSAAAIAAYYAQQQAASQQAAIAAGRNRLPGNVSIPTVTTLSASQYYSGLMEMQASKAAGRMLEDDRPTYKMLGQEYSTTPLPQWRMQAAQARAAASARLGYGLQTHIAGGPVSSAYGPADYFSMGTGGAYPGMGMGSTPYGPQNPFNTRGPYGPSNPYAASGWVPHGPYQGPPPPVGGGGGAGGGGWGSGNAFGSAPASDPNESSAYNMTGYLQRYLARMAITYVGVKGASEGLQVLRDFETGLADVGKRADLTKPEMEELGERVIRMSENMPIARNQLLDIASAAGQLGIKGTANIESFTAVIAKMTVATDLKGGQAADIIARLLNVTGEGVDSAERLGSVFVKLANDTVATESQIAHTAQYVAQATAPFHVASADAAGFAAALASIGVSAELGANSMGRLFQAYNTAVRNPDSQQMQAITQLTGRSPDDVIKSFGADPTMAVADLIKSLGEFTARGGDARGAMEALGIEAQRNMRVIPALAENFKLLGDALTTARREYKDNTALSEAYERQSHTLDSEITRLKNTIGNVVLQMRGSTGAMGEAVEWTRKTVAVTFELSGANAEASKSNVFVADSLQLVAAAATIVTGIKLAGWTVDAVKALDALRTKAGGASSSIFLLGNAMVVATVAVGSFTVGSKIAKEFELVGWAVDGAMLKFAQFFTGLEKFRMQTGAMLTKAVFGDFQMSVPSSNFKGLGNEAFNDSGLNLTESMQTSLRAMVSGANMQGAIDPESMGEALKQFLAEAAASADPEVKAAGGRLATAYMSGFTGLFDSNSVSPRVLNQLADIQSQATKLSNDAIKAAMDQQRGQDYAPDGKFRKDDTVEFMKGQMNEAFGIFDEYTGRWEKASDKAGQAAGDAFKKGVATQGAELDVLEKKQLQQIQRVQDAFTKTRGEYLDIDTQHRGSRNQASLNEFNKMLVDVGLTQDNNTTGYVDVKAVMKSDWNDTQKVKYLRDAYTAQVMYNEKLRDARDTANSFGDAVGSALEKAITGGGKAREIIGGLIKDMEMAILRQALITPVTNAVSDSSFSWIKSIMGFAAPVAGAVGGGGASAGAMDTGAWTMHAAGGVFDQPTMFRYGGSTHVMGESGPEGLLPLTKMSDGSLGVKAGGSGGGRSVTNVTNVNVYGVRDAGGFRQNKRAIANEFSKATSRG